MPPAGESAEQRNARRALNRSVLNAWGNSYCTGWIDFAG
jgi:hypothetical protein